MINHMPVVAYRKPLSLSGSDWKVYDPEKKDGRGQQSESVVPSDELIDLARRAQVAIGKDIIGFDFIATDNGYVIVDENGRPGLYEHCLEAAGTDIVEVITSLIISKLEIDKTE
jgi:glutathione synthase/RimK-type ligase-like ATP-grasp enzyme